MTKKEFTIRNNSNQEEWDLFYAVLQESALLQEYSIKLLKCVVTERAEPYGEEFWPDKQLDIDLQLEWWEIVCHPVEEQIKMVEFRAKNVVYSTFGSILAGLGTQVMEMTLTKVAHFDAEGKAIIRDKRSFYLEKGAIYLQFDDCIFIECEELQMTAWYLTAEEDEEQYRAIGCVKPPVKHP